MQQTSEPSLTMKISKGGKEKESKVGREKERRPRIPKESGFLSLHYRLQRGINIIVNLA